MNILGIETSCDETAVCVLEAQGDLKNPSFNVLGNALYSQTEIHAKYGGVFPALAKREHAKNLVPLFERALQDAELLHPHPVMRVAHATPLLDPGEGPGVRMQVKQTIKKILEREEGLYEALEKLLDSIQKPTVDLIAVTAGPGLEPALWVGINFALALGEAWNIPVMPTNHMEGHFFSALCRPREGGDPGSTNSTLPDGEISVPGVWIPAVAGTTLQFPALALLISGGHTELVLSESPLHYQVIGQTRDDAVGEAFDKVARILNLPYPGGPEISKLAAQARNGLPSFSKEGVGGSVKLPRPMIKSDDFDFSFSGLKTAVLYAVKKMRNEMPTPPSAPLPVKGGEKMQLALEFENAVTDVLVAKTKKALETYEVKTLILAGGVSANTFIREAFKNLIREFPDTHLLIPDLELSTDNAIMIAMAGYFDFISGKKPQKEIKAEGTMSL